MKVLQISDSLIGLDRIEVKENVRDRNSITVTISRETNNDNCFLLQNRFFSFFCRRQTFNNHLLFFLFWLLVWNFIPDVMKEMKMLDMKSIRLSHSLRYFLNKLSNHVSLLFLSPLIFLLPLPHLSLIFSLHREMIVYMDILGHTKRPTK